MDGFLSTRLRNRFAVRAWVVAARWTLAVAYLNPAAGPAKLAGRLFSWAEHPQMRAFFYGLAAAGPLWRLMGLAQIIAGVLLLSPRTAALGALAALPVTTGVLVTLFSLPFHTADRVAGVVLGAMNLSLLAWEAPRLAPLLGPSRDEPHPGRAIARAWRRPRVRRVAIGLGAAMAILVYWHVQRMTRQ